MDRWGQRRPVGAGVAQESASWDLSPRNRDLIYSIRGRHHDFRRVRDVGCHPSDTWRCFGSIGTVDALSVAVGPVGPETPRRGEGAEGGRDSPWVVETQCRLGEGRGADRVAPL